MTTFRWFASLLLAASIVPTLPAESHCPGNVVSVPFRLANRHQMSVALSVNHSGPYNLLLDTGTEVTMIDASLVGELHLDVQGAAGVEGPGFHGDASFAQVGPLEVGSHAMTNQRVLVYDLQKLDSLGVHIQGISGEDFRSTST